MRSALPTAAAFRSLPWRSLRPAAAPIDAIGSLLAAAALLAAATSGPSDNDLAAQAPTDPAGVERKSGGAGGAALVPVTRESMIGVYVGAPYTYPSDATIRKSGAPDFTAHGVQWEGKPFDNPIYYGVRIIRWLDGGRTGAMLDFTHSKTIGKLAEQVRFSGAIDGKPAPETAPLGEVFRRLEASHGHNMLTLNGLIRLPALGARMFPYAGLGAGITLPHSEVQLNTDPARTYEYQFAGPVGQALIGLEFRLPRVSYFLEYKFSLADYGMPLTHQDGSILFFDLWRQFSRWWSGAEPPGGMLSVRLTSHQVIGGVGVRFASPGVAVP